jgi:hypothetical protein
MNFVEIGNSRMCAVVVLLGCEDGLFKQLCSQPLLFLVVDLHYQSRTDHVCMAETGGLSRLSSHVMAFMWYYCSTFTG